MSTSDSPDWQNVVMLSSGPVTDAPDWQEVIVGPGGTPPVAGGTPFTWGPATYGWSGWVMDPAMASGGGELFGKGQLQFSMLYIGVTTTITHVVVCTPGLPVTLTANENFIGLYSAPGTGSTPGAPALLTGTATGVADTIAGATGFYSLALTPSLAVTAGEVLYAGFLFNWSTGTGPFFPGTSPFSAQNPGPPIAPGYWMQGIIYPGPYTALPSTLAAPTNAQNKADFIYWLAVI